MGDQILTLPAVRLAIQAAGVDETEIRLAGDRIRSALYARLLNIPEARILPFDELASFEDSPKYENILDFEFRRPAEEYAVPQKMIARDRYCRFEDLPSRACERISAIGDSYWHACLQMALDVSNEISGANITFSEAAIRFRRCPPEPANEAILQRIDRLLSNIEPEKPTIAITPGGYNPPGKLWPWENFVEIICGLLERTYNVMVLGSQSELELARKLYNAIGSLPPSWLAATPGTLTFLSGKTLPHELPYLLQRVRLHISNDNGVAHIAGALNIPQIILHRGASTTHETLGERDVLIFSGDKKSMSAITTKSVLCAADQILLSTKSMH